MADEANRQLDQCLVVFRTPLGAYANFAVAFEPRQGPLDVPTRLAQAGAMDGSTHGELWYDAALPELSAMGFGVIPSIALYDAGPTPGLAFFFPAPVVRCPRAGGLASHRGHSLP